MLPGLLPADGGRSVPQVSGAEPVAPRAPEPAVPGASPRAQRRVVQTVEGEAEVLAIILATSLSFYLPTSLATSGDCRADSTAMTDLDSVFVWYQVRYNPVRHLAYMANVAGMEGQPMVVPIATDSTVTAFVATQRRNGNRSCEAAITLNAPTSVVPETTERVQWYDIAGRRIEKPSHPGVYFRKQTGRVRVVTIR